MICILKSIHKISGIGIIIDVKLLTDSILKTGVCFRVENKNITFQIKDIERGNFDLSTTEYTYDERGENVYPILIHNFKNGNYKELEIGDIITSN